LLRRLCRTCENVLQRTKPRSARDERQGFGEDGNRTRNKRRSEREDSPLAPRQDEDDGRYSSGPFNDLLSEPGELREKDGLQALWI